MGYISLVLLIKLTAAAVGRAPLLIMGKVRSRAAASAGPLGLSERAERFIRKSATQRLRRLYKNTARAPTPLRKPVCTPTLLQIIYYKITVVILLVLYNSQSRYSSSGSVILLQ